MCRSGGVPAFWTVLAEQAVFLFPSRTFSTFCFAFPELTFGIVCGVACIHRCHRSHAFASRATKIANRPGGLHRLHHRHRYAFALTGSYWCFRTPSGSHIQEVWSMLERRLILHGTPFPPLAVLLTSTKYLFLALSIPACIPALRPVRHIRFQQSRLIHVQVHRPVQRHGPSLRSTVVLPP